jgi:hypothetical protein
MGRTRLEYVLQPSLIAESPVIVVAKFIQAGVVQHPQSDKGDEEYTLQCAQFEVRARAAATFSVVF